MIEGLLPNFRRHNPLLRITRLRPGWSSSRVKARPSAGRTPRIEKRLGETRAPVSRSGSATPESSYCLFENAATSKTEESVCC